MRAIRRALARVAATLRRHPGADDDLRAEMEAHLEMETEENIRRGMHPDEARRQAMIASGGLAQAAERVRDQRGLPWIEDLAADLRYALRHFRRAPLSTLTMIGVLSLGIGTVVVLFTMLSSLATMPAPGMARDASLARIRGTLSLRGTAEPQARLLSWPEVRAYAARADLFSGVAAYADETASADPGDAASAPLAVRLVYTTPNYFGLLGVRPALGAAPAADPDATRLAAPPTAMISDAMWRRRFGGARDVIGRAIRVNGVPVEIVGVAPPRFAGTDGGGAMAMWVPLAAYPLLQKRTPAVFASPDTLFLGAAARLRPGVAPRSAAAVVAGLAERASGADTARARESADVVPMLASNARVSQRADLLASGAAAGGLALLVLLITCANVSALLAGRAVGRRREIGVRLSLGAPRGRLVRQLLTESVLLALAAAAVGLCVTAAGIGLLGAALEDVQLVVDARVTLATCAVALVTGLLFGVSPALHATRVPLGEVLKSASSTVAATRSRLQRGLVVAQIALTQPLLVGLGVAVAGMGTGAGGGGAAPGVAGRIAEIEVDAWAGRVSPAERAARIGAAVERVAALPGVVAAMPLQTGTVAAPLAVHPADRVAGIAYAPAMEASLKAAPAGYFGALEIPIVRGRDFDAGERAHSHDLSRPVPYDAVIVGRELARRLWGGADPVGRRLVMGPSGRSGAPPMVVVGVVDDAAAGPGEADGRVHVYVPYAVLSDGVLARTAGPAAPLLDEMRALVAAEAPQMPVVRAQTMEAREARLRRDLLRASAAAAGGGLLALLLSAVGLYAVVAFGVGQRTREIGIRTALGAPRGRVAGMFFARGLALSAIGLLLGVPLSLAATRLVETTLRWPLTVPPLLGAAIGAVVLAVASVASWLPARRASAIDPLVALRAE